MDRIKEISSLLRQIKTASLSVTSKYLALMRSLQSAKGDMVDNVSDECNIDRKTALEYLKLNSLELIKDADATRTEIDNFVNYIIEHGINSISLETLDKFPHMTQVWMGDIYDTSGIDSLKHLLEDLKNQDKLVSEDYLVDETISYIKHL